MTANPKIRRSPRSKTAVAVADGADRRADRERRKGEAMTMMAADETIKVAEIARRTGLSKAVINGIRGQMKRELLVPTLELRRITQEGLQELTEDRLVRAIESIDDRAIQLAPLRERAYTADRLFNMRQLLRGEPTQIMTVDDRRSLNELAAVLVAEVNRRGITLEGEATVVPS